MRKQFAILASENKFLTGMPKRPAFVSGAFFVSLGNGVRGHEKHLPLLGVPCSYLGTLGRGTLFIYEYAN